MTSQTTANIRVVEAGGSTYVYPSDVDFSVYDPKLFNVELLIEQGLTDAKADVIPVIVDTGEASSSSVGTMDAISGLSDTRSLDSVGASATTIDKSAGRTAIERLDNEFGLDSVYLDYTVDVSLNESVEAIAGDRAQRQYGVNGSGVTVAVLDTGVDATHPDLNDTVINQTDFTGDGIGDRNGHGTHVAGTVAGDGSVDENFTGVAPGADIMDVKVLGDDGAGAISQVIEGIEYADTNGADIISMSLGGPGDIDDPIVEAVEQAEANGSIVVAAAGNNGPDRQTIGSPALAPSSITVGATDGSTGTLASFSSRGPTTAGIVKPDLVAPGVSIAAPNAGGAAGSDTPDPYVEYSGTSMATPHVSGVVAMMLDADPDATPDRVRNTLLSTTDAPVGDADSPTDAFAQGTGQVNASDAVSPGLILTNASESLGVVGDEPHINRTLTLENPTDDSVELLVEPSMTDVTDGTASETPWVERDRVELNANESATLNYSVATDVDGGSYAGEIVFVENRTDDQHRAVFGFVSGERVTVEKTAFSDRGSVEGDPVWIASGDETTVTNIGEDGKATFLATGDKYVVHSAGFDEEANQPISTAEWVNVSQTQSVTLNESETVPVTLNGSAFEDGVRSVQVTPSAQFRVENSFTTWSGPYASTNAKTVRFTPDSRVNASVAHTFAPGSQHESGADLDVDDVYYDVYHVLDVTGPVEYVVQPDEFATVNSSYLRSTRGEDYGIFLYSSSNRYDDAISPGYVWDVGDRGSQQVHLSGTADIAVNARTNSGDLWQIDRYENPSGGEEFEAAFQRLPATGDVSLTLGPNSLDVHGVFAADQPPHRLDYRALKEDNEAYLDNPYAVTVNGDVVANGTSQGSFSRFLDMDLTDGDEVGVGMLGRNPSGVLSTETRTTTLVTYDDDETADNTPPALESVEIGDADQYNRVDAGNVTIRVDVDSSDGVNDSAARILTAPGDVDDPAFANETVNPNGTWNEHDVTVTTEGNVQELEATVNASDYDGTLHFATLVADTGGDAYYTETRNAFHVETVPSLEDGGSGDDGDDGSTATEMITGELTTADGDPVAERSVIVNRRDTGEFLYEWAETEADGSFAVEVESGGVYDLTYLEADRSQEGFERNGNVDIQNIGTVDLSGSDTTTTAPDSVASSDASEGVTPSVGTSDTADAALINTTNSSLGTVEVERGHPLVVDVVNESGSAVQAASVEYRDAAPDEFFGTGYRIQTNASGVPISPDDVFGLEMNGSTDVSVSPPPLPRLNQTAAETSVTVNGETRTTVTLDERSPSAYVGSSYGDDDGNYTSIQAAVDGESEDALIVVENGTYNETVNVTKSVALVSEAAYETSSSSVASPAETILDGGDERTAAFVVSGGVDDVSIAGFHVRNYDVGIGTLAGNTTNVGVIDNTVRNVSTGIAAETSDGADPNVGWYVRQNVIDDPTQEGIVLGDTTGSAVLENAVYGDGDVTSDSDAVEGATMTVPSRSTTATNDTGTVVGIGVSPTAIVDGVLIAGNTLRGSYNDTGIGAVAQDADLTGVEVRDNDLGNARFQSAGVLLDAADSGYLSDAVVTNNTVNGTESFGAVSVSASGTESDTFDIEVTRNELADSAVGVAITSARYAGFAGDVRVENNDISNTDVGVGVGSAQDFREIDIERNDITTAEFGIGVETPLDPTTDYSVTIETFENRIENTSVALGVGGENARAFADADVFVDNDQGVVSVSGADAYLQDVDVRDNRVGLNASNGGYIDARQNEIAGNAEFGAIVPDGNATIEATGNWWGAVSGPGGGVADPNTGTAADGTGDNVTQNVTFDPWLEGEIVTASGTVLKPDNQPAAGVVTVLTENAGADRAEIDPEGSFVVSVENGSRPAVGYQGQVEGNAISTRDGIADLYTFGPDSIVEGDTDLGNYTLPEANVLNVTVVDETDTPVEDARVRIVQWEDTHGDGYAIGTGDQTTNADGDLLFPGADRPGVEVAGNVTVDVSPPEGSDAFADTTRTYDLTVTEDEQLPVELPPADATEIAVEPESDTVVAGDTLSTNVTVDTPENVTSADFVVSFAPDILNVTSVEAGSFLGADAISVEDVDNENGTLDVGISTDNIEGTAGNGTLVTAEFTAAESIDQSAETELAFSKATALNESNESIPVVTRDATVFVDSDNDGDDGPGGGEPSDPTVTAAITANQTEVFPGDVISFDASGSKGTDLTYEWTLGDGTSATGETVTHAYDATGTYNVTLTVVNASASDTEEITVSVVNPVTAEISANQTGVYPAEAISFNASASEGTNLAYNWTLGDGTNATGETVTHAYNATGTYNVTLTAANQSVSDTDRIAVRVVEPVTATLTAERTSASVGDIIEFDALGSTSDNRTANVTYEWEFGDGTTVSDAVVAHEYNATGTYTVTLIATDTVTGETTTDTVDVTIEEGTDNEVPGFGPLAAVVALLVSVIIARARD
ncbi:S8 family serine peptidase [Halorubrum sp. RMP-47]|uniref:S8 family serine peptidase n=1 Tax=Halorubrum miltondacostae TaxID=3076378 RepID=A0ABD5M0Z9_9EURY